MGKNPLPGRAWGQALGGWSWSCPGKRCPDLQPWASGPARKQASVQLPSSLIFIFSFIFSLLSSLSP